MNDEQVEALGNSIWSAFDHAFVYKGHDGGDLNVVNGLIGISQGLFEIAKQLERYNDLKEDGIIK